MTTRIHHADKLLVNELTAEVTGPLIEAAEKTALVRARSGAYRIFENFGTDRR
jgi:hypothetical protein